MNNINFRPFLPLIGWTTRRLIQIAVILPFSVTGAALLMAALVTGSGPSSLIVEPILDQTARLQRLAPAPQGYLNIEDCADLVTVVDQEENGLPVPSIKATCSNKVVKQVPISTIADNAASVLTRIYLILVVIFAFLLAMFGKLTPRFVTFDGLEAAEFKK